jgi:hypothetical protein
MTDIFGSLAQAKQELNFLRVRNLHLKFNMEQCVRNQLKEFPIHEVDQIITSIENVVKPTDSMENFYAAKLKNLTSRVGGLKMTRVGDQKCLCDCTGQYNEIVEDLAKHGGVDILTLLSTLGFLGTGGVLSWIAIALKWGAKSSWFKSTRKNLGNWVQESLHEHNLLDYTKVDTMESAFLWYFLVYKPESFELVLHQFKYLEGQLFNKRKEALLNKKKYGKEKNLNILEFISALQLIFSSADDDKIIELWKIAIKSGDVPDPNIENYNHVIGDINVKDPKTFINMENAFKEALWFGIDSNDVVEINALIALLSLDTIIKDEQNEFKKLIQDLIHFNYAQQPGSVKVFYGNQLYELIKKENFVYSERNLEYSKLYFSIIKNLPSNIEYQPTEDLNVLIKKLTNIFLSTEYTADVLKNDKGLQLVLTHILSLNEWNNDFKLKHVKKEFSDKFYNFQKQELLKIFSPLSKNLDTLKFKIYMQKSECSTLLKLDPNSLQLFEEYLETKEQKKFFMAFSYLHLTYLSNKNFDDKEILFNKKNFDNIISDISTNETISSIFYKNLKEQIFKEFDY